MKELYPYKSDGGGEAQPAEHSDFPIIIHVHDLDDQDRAWMEEACGIHSHTIESALDPDEIARFEAVDGGLDMIWKIPAPFPVQGNCGAKNPPLPVMSVGCFVRGERLIITTRERLDWMETLLKQMHAPSQQANAQEPPNPTLLVEHRHMDALMRLFMLTGEEYLRHLKLIKHAAREMQGRINRSMENEHLLKIFDLTERLVYYLDAIDSNLVMLERLREHLRSTKASIDRQMLGRVMIETRQAAKQAQIYSQVFAELMDARGTIVNNNMNVLIKNLTIINIIFLPLNLIAGIGGMSEFTLLTRGTHWALAYGILSLAMVMTGWLTWLWIRRGIGRRV